MLGESIHVVRKNETLSAIAQKYGVSTSAIQAYNNISNPNLLFVGKKLKIPGGAGTEIPYVVKKGDTLYSIAKMFNIEVKKLRTINKIEDNLINLGQELIITKN